MESRYTEEMKLWLFDLSHGNLSDEDIVKGFIKHYVLHDMSIGDIHRDIHFHTPYGNEKETMAKLKGSLTRWSDNIIHITGMTNSKLILKWDELYSKRSEVTWKEIQQFSETVQASYSNGQITKEEAVKFTGLICYLGNQE